VGIVDYTARLAADVLKWTYLRERAASESRIYFFAVWALVATGCAILLRFDDPLVLLVISACSGWAMMFTYSLLLVGLNLRALPAPLRPASWRVLGLLVAAAFYGYLTVLVVGEQVRRLS